MTLRELIEFTEKAKLFAMDMSVSFDEYQVKAITHSGRIVDLEMPRPWNALTKCATINLGK